VRLGVPNADKPDSQELCFVPDGEIGDFVERERGLSERGEIRDSDGRRVGEHQGSYRYTVGQRRGLNLGGGPPRYVLRVVPSDRSIVVGDDAQLMASQCQANAVSWCGEVPSQPFEADVRVRYRHAPARARVVPEGGSFRVDFHAPQRAITPGQAVVVYRGEEVVGGGIIA
jgi:tRNA-specific 2-thiouridylase